MLFSFSTALLLSLIPIHQVEDAPKRVPPLPRPALELQKEEALRIYGTGLLYEKESRLLDALKAFEKSLQLDPTALAPRKALVPIYIALDRIDDALTFSKYILEKDPTSIETTLLYAQQLKALGRMKEVADLLQRMARLDSVREQSDLLSRILHDLAMLQEGASAWKDAEATSRLLQTLLDGTGAEEILGVTPEELRKEKAENYERLGRLCLKNGDTQQAIDFYLKAQKLDAIRSGRLGFNLAQVYASQGKNEDALLRVDEFLQTQPLGTEGYELKIDLQKKLKRNKDILPELEQASSRDVHNGKLKLLLARELANNGNIDRAEAIYENLANFAPSPEIYNAIFNLYKGNQSLGATKTLARLDHQIQAASRKGGIPPEPGITMQVRAMLMALRNDPQWMEKILDTSVTQLRKGPPLGYDTCLALGTLAMRMGNAPAGEQLLRVSLKNVKTHPDSEAEIYSSLLKVLRISHQYSEVVALCKQGLDQSKGVSRALFHIEMAGAFLHMQRDAEALAAIDIAIKETHDRENLFCRRYRASLLSQMGRHDEAKKEAQALQKDHILPSEIRDIRYTLSAIYSACGEHLESEKLLQAILTDDPADATASNDLGYQWADRSHNLPQAEQLIRKALDLDRKIRETTSLLAHEPENPAYIDSLGWVLYRRGKLEDACTELEKASRLPGGNDDPVVFDHLGDVYEKLGKPARARECWQKATDLYNVVHSRRPDARLKEIQSKLKAKTN